MFIVSSGIMSKFPHFSIQSNSFFHFSCVGSLQLENVLVRSTESHTSLLIVILIVSHAKPAKFIFASTACHMHTTLILFNTGFALWAFLGIHSHPKLRIISSTFIRLHLFSEQIPIVAIQGNMSFFHTWNKIQTHIHKRCQKRLMSCYSRCIHILEQGNTSFVY